MSQFKLFCLFGIMTLHAHVAFANMPEVKYENLMASNTQMSLEKTPANDIKRMKIQRSIASEVENTSEAESKTKILGYIFILALPLFLGLWLMKVKGV